MNGSIRKRGDKSWELTMDLGRDEYGKRLRKFVSVKGTKAEAQRKLRELITAQERGMPLDTSKVTVWEFLETWLHDYAQTHVSPRTAQGYKGVVQRYLVPSLGKIPLVKLTPQHVQSLHADMLTKGLSPQTTLHAHRVLREALSHAVKWGLLARNVCDAVDPPKAGHKEMTSLDDSQVRKFLDAAVSSPYGPIFFLAVYTGMRRGELMGLRWSAVDLENGTISVTQTLIRLIGKGLKPMEPKTRGSRRLVDLAPGVVALLGGLRVKQKEEREALGLEWKESDYVFSRADGSLIDPDTITHAFADIIKRAGLPHVRLHDLRHTHASLMLKWGINSKIVTERLGHASSTLTLDTYSHVLPGLQKAAALRFEQMLQRRAPEEEPDAWLG